MLLRHAKATQDIVELADRERPLLASGLKAAKKLGKYLDSKKIKIDLILSSPAVRAHQTAQVIQKMLGMKDRNVRIHEDLYSSDCLTLIKVAGQTSNDIRSLMLVGHNPELDEVASFFLHKYHHFKTCALVILKFDIESWTDIEHSKPQKILVVD